MMIQWLKTGSYQKINQLQTVYLTNNKNIAFKSMVYHQVAALDDRVKIYAMVLRLTGDNYLLLGENMQIEGFGEKIKDNIFTLKTIK